MQSIADALAAWSVGVSLADLPAPVVHEAKRCLVDTIGVALAGTQHETARRTRELARAEFAPGSCSLLGDRARISAPGAALANGTAAMCLISTTYRMKPWSTARSRLFQRRWPPQKLRMLQARACSRPCRRCRSRYALGCALTPDLFWRGWWTTGLLGAFGATVAAARAFGLNHEQTRNAICFTASQTSSTYTVVGTPMKPFANGRAAQLGVEAALYARAGLAAHADAFEP